MAVTQGRKAPLNVKLEDTRIADIILAGDEPIRATRCMPGQPFGCRSNNSRCMTHDLWEELGHQIHAYLNSVSLADVCEGRVYAGPPHAPASPFSEIAAQ